jgi:diguanylate cyclase (GGDEF)-like protein
LDVVEGSKSDTRWQRQRAQELFEEQKQRIYRHTDRMFAGLMLFQWLGGLVAAVLISPRAWSGPYSHVHPHVLTAVLLGGLITGFPVYLALTRTGETFTRHVIGVGQVLMSALLIHLTGGRIETHFHIFGSLAFLAFYRDWRVIVTASAVVALDHLLRGALWPQSVYGTLSVENWRWLEHGGWVVFEDVFLILSCNVSLHEMQEICRRDAQLEAHNAELELQVEVRTESLSAANRRLESLATTDPLTSLLNHRALNIALSQELERSERYDRSCALLFLDLDHFKALNDGCGHTAGDAVLNELGVVARDCLRGIDTIGRWGGEEFVIILPETNRESALQVAERIRAAIAGNLFNVGGGVHLTCSIGVSIYPDDAGDLSSLVEAADRAMYAAKILGRNQARWTGEAAVATLVGRRDLMGSREEVTLIGIVEALVTLVGARDLYTERHTDDVCALATQIAIKLGLDENEARMVGLVGKLHDIGKVAVPDAILQKPGPLTPEEWALIREHPVVGANVVSHIPLLRITAPGIRGHHERWDGTGYPDGLAGEKIPLGARIVAVADAYCAMTTRRPYQAPRPSDQALGELKRCSGTQFDATVVDALEQILNVTAPVESSLTAVH